MAKKLAPIRVDEWKSELAALMQPEDVEGFTTQDVADEFKLSEQSARNRIARLLRAGKIKRVGVRPSGTRGRWFTVYQTAKS